MAVTGNIQTKNGKYHIVLNLRDENGKRKQKWISTELPIRGNKKAAERLLQEKLVEFSNPVNPFSTMTVAEYFEQWIKAIEGEVRPNTYRNYVANMENHIIPYFKETGIMLRELKPIQLEDYYWSKMKAGSKLKTREALSPTTIKHHHQNISKALTDAVRRGLIPNNPASAARTPKSEKFNPEFLNTKEVEDLLTLFKGSVIEVPVRLCAFYGFRRSEVLGLKWDAIDFERKTISIELTLQQGIGGNYEDKAKTPKSTRTMPMSNTIYELLKMQRSIQRERRKLMGAYYIESEYVCTWPNGNIITPNYLTKSFHSVISKSSLPRVRLHDLRHSAASNLLDMGFTVVEVADWLGHESPTTTLKFYAHVDKTSKVNMANALDRVLDEKAERVKVLDAC